MKYVDFFPPVVSSVRFLWEEVSLKYFVTFFKERSRLLFFILVDDVQQFFPFFLIDFAFI